MHFLWKLFMQQKPTSLWYLLNFLIPFPEQLTKFHFDFRNVIGKGGFGKVWLATLKKNNKLYAIKEMSKARIIHKSQLDSVINEHAILTQVVHPMLVNIHYAF